jgi:hypothetical protein
VQARAGNTGQTLADALTVKLEGKTEKQKNPHARGTLARAAWVIDRLGGWSGYIGGGYKPPAPKPCMMALSNTTPSGEAGPSRDLCDSRRLVTRAALQRVEQPVAVVMLGDRSHQ